MVLPSFAISWITSALATLLPVRLPQRAAH